MFLKHFDFCKYVLDYAPMYDIGQTKEKYVPMLQKIYITFEK